MVSDILSRVRSMHMSLGDGDPEELLEAAFPVSLKAIFSVFSILLELLFYFPVWKPWLYLSTLLYILSPKDTDIQSQEAGGQIEDKSNKIVTPSTFWGCHLPWLENWAPCPQFRLLRLRLPLCWYFRATVGSPRGGHEWREVGKLFVYSPWALGDTQDQEDCPSCRDWCQDGKPRRKGGGNCLSPFSDITFGRIWKHQWENSTSPNLEIRDMRSPSKLNSRN